MSTKAQRALAAIEAAVEEECVSGDWHCYIEWSDFDVKPSYKVQRVRGGYNVVLGVEIDPGEEAVRYEETLEFPVGVDHDAVADSVRDVILVTYLAWREYDCPIEEGVRKVKMERIADWFLEKIKAEAMKK